MLILFSLSILLYSNTWKHGFALDDTMMILDNNYTKGGFQEIPKILSQDAFAGFLGEGKNLLSGGRYRPLSQIIFNIQYQIWGENAKLWHVQNTLFFAGIMVLAFVTLLKLFKKSKTEWSSLAFITTLIGLSHPLNTEVVANIKSFDLLLTSLFSLLSLYWSFQYWDTSKKGYLVASFISLLLGILSKETAITFLAVIPLSILFFRRFESTKFISLTAILILSTSSYFLLRFSLLGIPKSVEVTELLNNPFLHASIGEHYATILYSWWHYIQLFLFPIDLTHDYYPYTFGLKNWADPLVIFSVLFHLSLTIWAVYQLYRTLFITQISNFVAYGWLFYMLIFSISSNLFVGIGAFMNERFIFLASMGLSLMLAYLILALAKKMMRHTLITIYLISIPLVSIFALKTIDRNKAWQDDYTLFTTDVLVSSNSAKCNVSAGGKSYENALKTASSIKKTALLREAEKYLLQGIKIHPKYVQAYILLGNVYFEQNKLNQAFTAYQQSIELGERKDAPINLRSLAIKTYQEKDYTNSLKVLSYCKQFLSDPIIDYYIAENYLQLMQVDTAIQILNNLIQDYPTYDEAYNKLGEIYGRVKNDLATSEHYLIKGYEINPSNFSICENLGTLQGIRGNFEQSLFFFQKSLSLMKEPNAQIYSNIAATYSKMGKEKEAKLMMQKAIELSNPPKP